MQTYLINLDTPLRLGLVWFCFSLLGCFLISLLLLQFPNSFQRCTSVCTLSSAPQGKKNVELSVLVGKVYIIMHMRMQVMCMYVLY